MAIAQPVVQVVKRSEGRSAVGCAAYRAGEKLKDDRLGKTFNYEGKGDVAFTEILAPENAPAWVFDRGELWNRAEAKERQKNGQPAREVLLILPRELSDDERVSLVRGFAQKQWVDKGMVADICHHAPVATDGGKNYHAHVMLTMRRLDGGDFAKTKERQWNRDFTDGGISTNPKEGAFFNKKGTDARGWVGKNKTGLMGFRQAWEVDVNAALEESGSTERVDLRSYKEQGLDIEPQQKIGIHAEERRGRKTAEIAAANDNIHDRNEVRKYLAPQYKGGKQQRSSYSAGRASWVADIELMQGIYDSERNLNARDVGVGHDR